jgi:hypothetical protein
MDDKTVEIYPYCYKIKDNCPPCNNQPPDNLYDVNTSSNDYNDCVYLLAKYLAVKSNRFRDKHQIDNAHMNIANCLQKYGDMYKTVGIELYVNPKTKQILFPDHQRIISNYNIFLNEIGLNEATSQKDTEIVDNKIKIYQILLNDKLREIYNEFYQSAGFSDLDSIMPKEYGISRLLNIENNTKGGKRMKSINKRKINSRRISDKKRKTKKRTNTKRTNTKRTNTKRTKNILQK